MVSISAISSGIRTAYRYGSKIIPELGFGTASEAVGQAMKMTKGSAFQKAEAGWKVLKEESGLGKDLTKGHFFKKFWANCKNLFPDMKKAYQAGSKEGVWKGIKSVFNNKTLGLGKKMPFIMSAVMIFELPNVIKATKEQGIFQGGKEVLKFGLRMAGAGAGAAIGAALPIPFGSLIGWTVGEWLTSKIVGKSYTEQQAEKEEIIKQALQPQQPQQSQTVSQAAPNPYGLNTKPQQVAFSGSITNPYNQYQMQSTPYANDIMMKQMPFNVVA